MSRADSCQRWVAASNDLARNPVVSGLLGSNGLCSPWVPLRSADICVGWGRRPHSERLRARASRSGCKFVTVEDGFLRSFFPGQSSVGLSIVVDEVGIYFDATAPSALENLLNSDEDLIADMQDRLESARALIVSRHLSKYNHAPLVLTDTVDDSSQRCERVLIVDQTQGDKSVSLGLASSQSFDDMLSAARARHPEATIYVKTHPEVTSGAKRGYLSHVSEDDRLIKITGLVNPISLMQQMDHVYVVTSTMGFEALLLGKHVTCFGMPWYAGWGVTRDALTCERRVRSRSVLELFAAAYFRYARYWDPERQAPGSIVSVIDWLHRQRELAGLNEPQAQVGHVPIIGMQGWKTRHLKPILDVWTQGRAGQVRGLIWGAGEQSSLQPSSLVRQESDGLARVEDGMIRSVGLGSDLVKPLSLVLDRTGIYFDATRPSDLERILQQESFAREELERAEWIRAQIVRAGLTKYNVDTVVPVAWPSGGRHVLLIPGQVEDDASIRLGCFHGPGGIDTNLGLIRAVRKRHPDAFIVYKPHPDVAANNRRGRVMDIELATLVDHVEREASIISCLLACDSVHTMTSLTGFDALLRGIPVHTYGVPFYAGWGLTTDHACYLSHGSDVLSAFGRRQRRLTLGELVAGVLLRYAVYLDWQLGGFTRCEAVIAEIERLRKVRADRNRGPYGLFLRLFPRLARGVRKSVGWVNLDNRYL